MSLVLDASAAVDLVLGRPELTVALVGHDLHVPSHFDVETVSALRQIALRSLAEESEVDRARSALARLSLVRYPAVALVDRAWEIRGSITIQDGVYVALAEGLGTPLFTTDHRLARAAENFVEVLAPGR